MPTPATSRSTRVDGVGALVVGGAGFIGSHVVDGLLMRGASRVTVFDNFSSGRRWRLAHVNDPRLEVIAGDVHDLSALARAMRDSTLVFHLASNPDISRAELDPDIDFREGTELTRNVLEAMRQCGAKRIFYTSGSGVYGDLGERPATEDHGPLVPISTYGASKLAGEALISSYGFMFGIEGRVFRLGNVVGPRQSHGVGFDFIRRLLVDPTRLRILGDGRQSKPYVDVSEVVDAMFFVHSLELGRFEVFNVATQDALTVTEIAELARSTVGTENVSYEYSGSDRGWRGDIPIVRLSSAKLAAAGFELESSSRAAMSRALAALAEEVRRGVDRLE
ncbi:MAG: NAD-dependent epimerase/dehydratase family protein [Deltaproteobacteria bacterium]|nr:NAD-dependent epimerase/dehydratase family protein [Deltaproteobacteria bacterium]